MGSGKSLTMQVLISLKCEGFKHVKMVLDLHFEQTWLWYEYQIAGDGGDWRDSGNFDLDVMVDEEVNDD